MRRFGLIGFPLAHSFSQKFFTEKFKREEIRGCVYDNFPIPDINELPALLRAHPDLKGLNVTIPYKERIVSFLDEMNDVVQQTGACNCIRVRNGRLAGFNTDTIGFKRSLQAKLLPSHRKGLILGRGGAAKAVAYALEELDIEFLYVVRKEHNEPDSIQYNELDEFIIRDHLLIINTTPLGTFPDIDTAPSIPYKYLSDDHYLYDLVYNPGKTVFLQRGEERGAAIQNGADMLVIQAEESWKIWNEKL